MTAPRMADVLVVGAGPAGAVAATALARADLRVLLADDRGASGRFDVLLTGPAVRALDRAGLRERLPLRPVDGIDLRFGGSRRTFDEPAGSVCRWHELRRALRAAAVGAGARYVPGRVTSLSPDVGGYHAEIELAGRPVPVFARHAVVATGGAAAPFAAETGSRHDPDPPAAETGPRPAGITCVRRYRGIRLGSRVIVAVPAPAATELDGRPGCAWALPGDDGTVTVGTTQGIEGDRACPEDLLRTCLLELADADPRFGALRPAGPLITGPLNASFTPGHVAQARFLLAGDAAGLANPLNGEGLSSAVHSALLAARFITANPLRPDVARRRYARRLATTFVGHFETARHAVRHYHLTWRLLAAGADTDHPAFAKGRRALLLPDGMPGLTAVERIQLTSPDAAVLGPFLAACDEIALSIVRGEWPFLARLALAGESLGHHSLRPGILFGAALMTAGREPDVTRAPLGAAIEMASLGALSLVGPAPPPPAGRGVDWALAGTVLAGDFLLAQAARLVADNAPELSWSFADWLTELAALRAGRLDDSGAVPAGALYASLLEFPARIGAQLGGASPAEVAALRGFGQHCGHAFLHAEDALAVCGERTRLDATFDAMVQGRISAIPDSLAGRAVSQQAFGTDQRLRSMALAAAATECRRARRHALEALTPITDPATARILRGFAEALAEPADPVALEPSDRPLTATG